MIEIRDIVLDDVERFHQCLDDVAREQEYLALTKAPPLEETRAFVEDAIDREDVRVVAVDGPDIVGWCDVACHRYPHLDHVGQLGMGVLAAHRRKGLGARLLQAAVERARSAGMEKIELDVFASNHGAIRLYETAGFHHEGRRIRARKVGEAYDDLLQMGLMLGEGI